jgi:hypothetical protein
MTYPTQLVNSTANFYSARTEIADSLIQNALLYPSNVYTTNEFCVAIWGSIIFVSTSQTSLPGSWDIKASIDSDMKDICEGEKPLTLNSYHCTMNASAVDWVINNINSSAVLESWILPIRGFLVDYPSIPVNETIASMLEVLTMVGYGGRTPTSIKSWGIQHLAA